MVGNEGDRISKKSMRLSLVLVAVMPALAAWAQPAYMIISSAGPNGSISPGGAIAVTYGSDLGFTATPDTGYQVDEWSVDGSVVQTGGSDYTLSNIQADHTVEVTFKINTYTIISSAGPNGSISPGGAIAVTYGSDLGFTATPDPGYQVDEWLLDGETVVQVGGTSYTLENIQADHNVHVTFKQLEYTVTVGSTFGGSTDQDGTHTISHGETLTITASPDIGYR
jgi:hypothetical protein